MTFKKIVLALLLILTYGIVIFLVSPWGEKFFEVTQRRGELETNQQKWQSKAITHYRFYLRISCFCDFLSRTPFLVEIKDGKVVSVVDNEGESISITYSSDFNYYSDLLTINGLFDHASKAILQADEFHINYNSEFGYPDFFDTDWNTQVFDDEVSITITEFEPLP